MMNFSINSMVTGNKIIILCKGESSTMFPFASNELPCQMPIGNRSNIKSLVDYSMNQNYEVIVLAPLNDRLVFELANKKVTQIKKENNYLKQIYDLCKDCKETIIIEAESVFVEDDLDALFSMEHCNEVVVAVKSIEKYETSTDHICIQDVGDEVAAFLGHPRVHYANKKACGFSKLNKIAMASLRNVSPGFHNVNCGQMPAESFFVEEALQNYIELGNKIHCFEIKHDFTSLKFPWDIRKANYDYCKNIVASMSTTKIDASASVDNSCIIHGNIVVGKNSAIKENVIIEGNCIVGDNVVIEKNVVIGSNCVIGTGSKLQYTCKISESTVIGNDNKIGFTAEVTGVTFQGVSAVHNCEVYGVIGKKVDIAAGVQMAVMKFDDSLTKQKVQSKFYANEFTNSIFIGDYTRTGINNIFYPGIKVGTKSALGPGLIVSEDVPSETLVLVEQNKILKSWGSNRYGW